MVVNDETASLGPTTDGRFSLDRATASFGPNVEAYSGEDILARPPDVMVVGRRDYEQPMHELWRRLSATRPVVFCGYSGVFQAPYNFRRYHGIIATDVATRILARTHGVPALKFFPDFDFDAYPFVPEPPSDRVILRSYTNHFAKRFPFAHAFHAECVAVLRQRFGSRVRAENVQGVARQRAREMMTESTATLHIKNEEGFGWSVVESLATGRPVISQAGLSRSMAYREWLGPSADALLFDTPADLVPIVQRLLDDPAWRAGLQVEAAETIRRRYDPAAKRRGAGRVPVRARPRRAAPLAELERQAPRGRRLSRVPRCRRAAGLRARPPRRPPGERLPRRLSHRTLCRTLRLSHCCHGGAHHAHIFRGWGATNALHETLRRWYISMAKERRRDRRHRRRQRTTLIL